MFVFPRGLVGKSRFYECNILSLSSLVSPVYYWTMGVLAVCTYTAGAGVGSLDGVASILHEVWIELLSAPTASRQWRWRVPLHANTAKQLVQWIIAAEYAVFRRFATNPWRLSTAECYLYFNNIWIWDGLNKNVLKACIPSHHVVLTSN